MEPGHAGNPGKECETEVEVLEYGVYKVRNFVVQVVSCVTCCCFVNDLALGNRVFFRYCFVIWNKKCTQRCQSF